MARQIRPMQSTTEVTTTSGSLPSITFSQAMDVEKMTNLTIGQALNQTRSSENVVISFNNVLTRLDFSAKLDSDVDDDNSVSITGLKLLGSSTRLISEATFTFASDGTNGVWDTTDGGGTVYGSDLDIAEIVNFTESKYAVTSTIAKSLLEGDNYLFLIPPYSKSGIESEGDISLEITYEISAKEGGSASSTATKELSLPIGSLVESTAYNIVITIGLDEVTLTADETSWDSDSDEEEDPEPDPDPTPDPDPEPEPEPEPDPTPTPDPDDDDDDYYVPSTSITTEDAEDVVDGISDAFKYYVDEYTVNYEGDTENLTIAVEIPTSCYNYDMDIVFNLPDQTNDVTISIPSSYTGGITIYAPQASVTADATATSGATYNDVTVTTAANTLTIPKGVVVDGLTILGGNIEVQGTLKGDVARGASNQDDTTTITFDTITNNKTTSIGENINVKYNEAVIDDDGEITVGAQDMTDDETIEIN